MIVICCQDLIFATRIRSAAEDLDLSSRPARDQAMLQARLDQTPDGKLNEPVTGVVVDLAMDEALERIAQARAHDPQLPIVAFGSHVERDRLAAAQKAGADEVLPRSAFVARLPHLLQSLGGPA